MDLVAPGGLGPGYQGHRERPGGKVLRGAAQLRPGRAGAGLFIGKCNRPSLWKIFRIFGRPFEAVRADDRVSRRDECISTGQVRPGSAPRGPGDIMEQFSGRSLVPLARE